MPRPRPPAALATLFVLAFLLAGCGGGTDVDYTKTEETVRASLESKSEGFGVRVREVDCPSGVAVEPGTEFECTVKFPGGGVAYALLKIRDSDADLSLRSLSRRPPLQ